MLAKTGVLKLWFCIAAVQLESASALRLDDHYPHVVGGDGQIAVVEPHRERCAAI